MKKSKELLTRHLPLILFLVFYFFINAHNIISKPTPFYDWDESIYMQVGREMFQKHSVIPLWQGHPWLEKPPLIPFVFGLTTLLPVQTEVAARLVSLIATIAVLLLIYLWQRRILKKEWLSLLGVVLVAFNPVFVQRAQVVNGDTFLLIGWLGYLLFFSDFWLSFFFLFLGMMSKSLLGFYPALLMTAYYLYRYFFEKKKKELMLIYPVFLQIAILSVWYVLMLLIYKGMFLEMHFQDHLLRRVTQSIESHFGQRTFYIDEAVAQYGWFLLIAAASALYILHRFLKKKIEAETVLYILFLAPWFVFLNVTKTKIAWYLYPAIPLFPLLIIYPLSLFKFGKKIVAGCAIAVIAVVLYTNVLRGDFFKGSYSRFDSYYAIATAARLQCTSLSVLVSPNDRQAHDTLKKLNDLLSTTDWYDGHPAMAYYSEISTTFIYDTDSLARKVETMKKKGCLALEQTDEKYLRLTDFRFLKTAPPLILLQRN